MGAALPGNRVIDGHKSLKLFCAITRARVEITGEGDMMLFCNMGLAAYNQRYMFLFIR